MKVWGKIMLSAVFIIATPHITMTSETIRTTVKVQTINSRELDCLTQAIYFEAGNQSAIGKVAVGKVILNRKKHPLYPKTICGVISQGKRDVNGDLIKHKCQFSFMCDGQKHDIDFMGKAFEESNRIAKLLLRNPSANRELDSFLFYHADYVSPKWSNTMKKELKIGNHIFYSLQ